MSASLSCHVGWAWAPLVKCDNMATEHYNFPPEKLLCMMQGVVELVSDYTVCKAGDVLTPNQAALLRVFEIKQAAFHITPICRWQAEGEQCPS